MKLLRHSHWMELTAHIKREKITELRNFDDALWNYEVFLFDGDDLTKVLECLHALYDWIDKNGHDPNAKQLNKSNALDEIRLGVIELCDEKPPVPSDLNVAMRVRDKLSDVRIADVDFSPAVKTAAMARMFNGRSLYDIVKEEWDTVGQDHGSPRAQLDRALVNMKMPFNNPKAAAETISAMVLRHKFAVCESIAATVIHLCKKKGFKGRLELIGIPYDKISGHAIVVANRSGELGNLATWGDNFFIIDMWYYNLGMRTLAIWAGTAKDGYVDKDIRPFTATSGGLKCLLDTDTPTGAPVGKKTGTLSDLMARNTKL